MADFELPGYEIYERLGRGGMASVYRALHLNLDREVAIKVMDPAMSADESFSERFIREARISARLTHPHILQIYDVNTYEGLNYIAMELLPGGELADFIHGEMPQRLIYAIVEQITDALDYAAGRGYVHRDIKPSNIMLRSEQDFVLADFGIARAANSGTQMTQTGLMVGTPSYMSPEQAKGHEVDGRSDLYALAVLTYEMLTKQLPYESESAVTTAVKHLTEDIPTLSGRLSAYQDFFNKGLAKSVDDRFQTGRELYEGLMDASVGFAEDEVLTGAVESPPRHPSRSLQDENDKTSLAGFDAATSLGPAGPSVSLPGTHGRPYRLENSLQRERMVSGTYGAVRSRKKSGGSLVKWLAVVVVVAGLGGGGYLWWQEQQGGSAKNLRDVTAELATAYGAMSENDLQSAASAFFKVLSRDRDNAAATQGMAQVEDIYMEQIESAISTRDLALARDLLEDFTGYFAGNLNLERYSAEVALMEEEANLAEQQAAFAMAQAETAAQDEASAAAAQQLAAAQAEVDDLLQQARTAAAGGDFAAARAAVEASLTVLPESTQARALLETLGAQESAWKEQQAAKRQAALAQQEEERRQRQLAQQQKALADAQAAAASGLRSVDSGMLEKAQATYRELEVQFGELAAVQRLGQALLQGYASAAREQVDLKEFDAAEQLVSQGQAGFPGDAIWLELQAEIETGRANARRRLGAY